MIKKWPDQATDHSGSAAIGRRLSEKILYLLNVKNFLQNFDLLVIFPNILFWWIARFQGTGYQNLEQAFVLLRTERILSFERRKKDQNLLIGIFAFFVLLQHNFGLFVRASDKTSCHGNVITVYIVDRYMFGLVRCGLVSFYISFWSISKNQLTLANPEFTWNPVNRNCWVSKNWDMIKSCGSASDCQNQYHFS